MKGVLALVALLGLIQLGQSPGQPLLATPQEVTGGLAGQKVGLLLLQLAAQRRLLLAISLVEALLLAPQVAPGLTEGRHLPFAAFHLFLSLGPLPLDGAVGDVTAGVAKVGVEVGPIDQFPDDPLLA